MTGEGAEPLRARPNNPRPPAERGACLIAVGHCSPLFRRVFVTQGHLLLDAGSGGATMPFSTHGELCPCTLEDLPDHVLLHVLSFLDPLPDWFNAALACRVRAPSAVPSLALPALLTARGGSRRGGDGRRGAQGAQALTRPRPPPARPPPRARSACATWPWTAAPGWWCRTRRWSRWRASRAATARRSARWRRRWAPPGAARPAGVRPGAAQPRAAAPLLRVPLHPPAAPWTLDPAQRLRPAGPATLSCCCPRRSRMRPAAWWCRSPCTSWCDPRARPCFPAPPGTPALARVHPAVRWHGVLPSLPAALG